MQNYPPELIGLNFMGLTFYYSKRLPNLTYDVSAGTVFIHRTGSREATPILLKHSYDVILSVMYLPCTITICVGSLFCNVFISVLSGFAIILQREREREREKERERVTFL